MILNWSFEMDYSEESVNKYILKSSGVYKIIAVLKNGNTRVDYVGQAKNLEERAYQHLDKSEPNKALSSALKEYLYKFSFARVDYKDDRDAIERALYNHYKPRFNDPNCIPNVKPMDINFD